MTAQLISAQEVWRRREAGEPVRIIDVRTAGEFGAVHADGAESIPLDQLQSLPAAASDQLICFICQSGARSARACERFAESGISNIFSIEGGTTAWQRARLPIVRGKSNVISLERQVRIAAGALTLIGVVGGFFIHPIFYALSAFVGAGLIFAGVTDFCGMALLLARLPWNRRP
jgi:rhodanese-related sulfurtransferase